MSAKDAAMWWDGGNQENGKRKEDKRGKQWPMSTTSDTAFSFIFGEGPLKWTLTLEYLKIKGKGKGQITFEKATLEAVAVNCRAVVDTDRAMVHPATLAARD